MHRFAAGLLVAFLAVLSCSLATAAEPTIWTLEEAAKQVGKQGTIEFKVQSSRLLESGKFCFLNSEKNFQDKANFTVAISAAALEKYKTAGIENPAEHFRDKTVQVTGKVAIFKERLQIQVDDPQHLVIVAQLMLPKKK